MVSNNSNNIEGITYYQISKQNLLHAYNKGKQILWIFKTDHGLDNIIFFFFSKRSELGEVIIEHIKSYIEMKTVFNIPFSSKYFFFVLI